ncbi:MAG: transcription-repair coupling factor (superfamily II helicase) [Kiritimatiellia bacterium]|jgi:transcription-repair coupling factor (superfamily II helicase)
MIDKNLKNKALLGPLLPLLKRGSVVRIAECSSTAYAWLCLGIVRQTKRPLVVVADGPRTLEAIYQDLHTLSGNKADGIWYYPGWEAVPGQGGAVNLDLAGDRLQALLHCGPNNKQPFILVTSIQALMQRTVKPEELEQRTVQVAVGDVREIEAFTEELVTIGYEFTYEVLNKGEATRRGGLIDVWPLDAPDPVRIEFFGEEIESIRSFHPGSQRSLDKVTTLLIGPATDAFGDANNVRLEADVADYLPKNTCWAWFEPDKILDHARIYESSMQEADAADHILTYEHLSDRIQTVAGGGQVFAGLTEIPYPEIALDLHPCAGLADIDSGNMNPDLLDEARVHFIRDYADRAQRGEDVLFCFTTQGSLDRFRESFVPRVEGADEIVTELGMINEGFSVPSAKFSVVAESDLYGFRKALRSKYDLHSKTRKGSRAVGERVSEWTDIQVGELVVHVDHGIGRYQGLYEIEFNGRMQEVLSVEYAAEAKLHIPVNQAHLLSRYIAAGQANPTLHRLGSKKWQKDKEAAQEAINDLAAHLLETQAARDALPGHAFGKDTHWQHEFEQTFPYQETFDQDEAIKAVKHNMESPQPMDRLVCGDVGYGKTEVAMRAAFKAVMDGKQVAILVPTTILCQQHFESFRERMTTFPVTIEMLSRFRTRKEQNETIRKLRTGQVDIIIGTHRLVQQDVSFKDLGLVIIDEEQRFGVKHKERLKDIKQLVDVLTMTATPIPRTLYLSLTGAKEMSTISTPPRDRQPIETFVRHWDDEIVRKAILRELNREGQVFVLHNRVQTIRTMEKQLKTLVPEAKIIVAHGQMPEARLEEVMQRFIIGEYDVLLCTTIIESGVDIPNANTMIIDRADRFGLAELYQLRGRVGRYKNKAYAYLMVPEKSAMRAIARQRIRAIQRYSSLGAGFKLALRDLEIRGAGNILGAQQSGHIAAVGFDLYCRLLDRTVKMLKNEKVPDLVDVTLRIDWLDMSTSLTDYESACVIPVDYVEEEGMRVDLYKSISSLSTPSDIKRLAGELKDRFGRLPQPVKNLLAVASIRVQASRKGIKEIDVRGDKVMLVRQGDYLSVNGRFPRLTTEKPNQRLEEIEQIIRKC